MVTVKITETYDMKTTVGKIGILGIHTPDGELVRRLYPGLLKSHKFIRFLKCDVVGACASVLPADPLQVGVTAGDVAPEDMFNPILYKAVTNESFDTLVSRVMRAGADVTGTGSLAWDQPSSANWTEDVAFKVYYGLLADNGEFRKAMPQSGFAIKNLVPICHTLISNYGNLAPIDNIDVEAPDSEIATVPDLTSVNLVNERFDAMSSSYSAGVVFRGKPVRMPKLPIHYKIENWNEIPEVDFVKTMVACLIVPPAKLHEFYYRVRVTWYARFEEVCSTNFAGNGSAMLNNGTYSYAKNYTYDSAKQTLDKGSSSVDATNVEIEKIMES